MHLCHIPLPDLEAKTSATPCLLKLFHNPPDHAAVAHLCANEAMQVSAVREGQTELYLARNMADTRTANISKLVLKQAGRAKEKVRIATSTYHH